MSNVEMFPFTKREQEALDKVCEIGKLNPSDLATLLFELKLGRDYGLFTPSDMDLVEYACKQAVENLQCVIDQH